VSGGERFWTSRIRWRLRGATLWPVFVVATLLDGLILDLLPPVATTGLNYLEGVLIATFGNLFLVGVLAPFLTKRLARRRQVAPAGGSTQMVEVEVLRDRVGTALLFAGVLGCVASGLANVRVINSETDATQEAAEAIGALVARGGSEELKRNNEAANTLRLGEGFFRICIPHDDRERFFCWFVDTKEDPAKVDRDPSVEPNTVIRSR